MSDHDTITHRGTRIHTIDEEDDPVARCRPGDIALQPVTGGWAVWFVGDGGEVEGYDEPFPSRQEALWAAKAAAEFSGEHGSS